MHMNEGTVTKFQSILRNVNGRENIVANYDAAF